MAQILITGGAGFIGSALAAELAGDPQNFLVIVDNLITGELSKVPALPNVSFIQADVNVFTQIAPVFHDWKFDVVFHYAALVGVKRTLENPVKVLNDIDGIRNILTLCRNTTVPRVVFSSSSEVYGEPVHIPQHEHTTPLNSRLPYAIVKNVGEAFLRSYAKEYALEFSILRFFNTYGPGQSLDFVVSRFIRAALEGNGLQIYGDGSQTRTFCYIADNVEATAKAWRTNQFVNDVVNIGSDHEISILELARTIIDLTGSDSPIIHLPPLAEGDMSRRKPDISRMRQLLGRDLTSLEAGLSHLIPAFR
ncbi:MAG: NAD-dependent epimerase/dehydratase family protein [Flavobacteriales bacterium]|jgi:UDP-glucuronate decarboxylase